MSSPALEEFLARLFTDEQTLTAFLRKPAEIARAAGLDDAEVSALVDADHIGPVMAAASSGPNASDGKAMEGCCVGPAATRALNLRGCGVDVPIPSAA